MLRDSRECALLSQVVGKLNPSEVTPFSLVRLSIAQRHFRWRALCNIYDNLARLLVVGMGEGRSVLSRLAKSDGSGECRHTAAATREE